MGNEGSVNLGIVGADWSEDGGGATFMGMRIGGSGGRGAEIGFNPGLGVQVDGHGLYAGARADVGIRDGINVGAGARAVALNEGAGAAAQAKAHASGSSAESAATTNSNVRHARDRMQQCRKEVDTSRNALRQAKEKVENSNRDIEENRNIIADYKRRIKEASDARDQAGRDKIEANDLKLKYENDRQQIDVEEFTRKLKRIARKSPGSEEFQQLEIIVTDRQAAIKHLETKIEEFTARRSRFSRELCALQEKLGNAERKLVSVKVCQVEALELLKQRELVLRKNEKNLEEHEREFNQASREKNEQEKYQRLLGRST